MRWWWGPLCTRPTRLVGILIVLALQHNSLRIDMSPTRTLYPDSKPTNLWSFSLRGHMWGKKRSYKIGDLLKEVQFIGKRWPVNTVDCLIEVTAWAGLIVFLNRRYYHTYYSVPDIHFRSSLWYFTWQSSLQY
jgi:hypothetical protein